MKGIVGGLARYLAALVALFLMFFLMSLLFTIGIPLVFERALDTHLTVPFGLAWHLRLASILGAIFSILGLFGVKMNQLGDRLEQRARKRKRLAAAKWPRSSRH